MYIDDPKPVTTLQRTTVKFLIIAFSERITTSAIALPKEVSYLVGSFYRLAKLVVEVQLTAGEMKNLVENLIMQHPSVDLYVPVFYVNTYYKRLFKNSSGQPTP